MVLFKILLRVGSPLILEGKYQLEHANELCFLKTGIFLFTLQVISIIQQRLYIFILYQKQENSWLIDE